MTRLKVFFAGLGMLTLLAACNDEDMSVYRELLTETLWYSADPVPMPDSEVENAEVYLYSFDHTGILTVYPSTYNTALPGSRHRYIYDTDKSTMAVEGLGLLDVTYIDTDRVELRNDNHWRELRPYRNDIDLPDDD